MSAPIDQIEDAISKLQHLRDCARTHRRRATDLYTIAQALKEGDRVALDMDGTDCRVRVGAPPEGTALFLPIPTDMAGRVRATLAEDFLQRANQWAKGADDYEKRALDLLAKVQP